MFVIKPNGLNRLDMELSGKLTAEEMERALDEFAAESILIEHGKMLYRVHDLQWPTWGGLVEDLRRMPEMLHTMRQYERIAVLADKQWLRRVSEWEGSLMKHLEIKAFALEDEAEAEKWLAAA